MVTVEQIKELRQATGVSVAECKKALEAADGDFAKAQAALQAAGAAVVEKKAGRQLGAGVISAYIHTDNQMGALVELDCETDFVAKHEEFRALAADLAMQVAAFAPADVETMLGQPFVKDQGQTVNDRIQAGTQKFGEKIVLVRFERFATPGR